MSEITEDTSLETRIKLNVGGARFETTLRLLRKFPDSLLGTMFSGRAGRYALVRPDETGVYFLDRDPVLFALILHFLRQGFLDLPENIQAVRNLEGNGSVPFSVARLDAELNYYLIPEEARKETVQLMMQRARSKVVPKVVEAHSAIVEIATFVFETLLPTMMKNGRHVALLKEGLNSSKNLQLSLRFTPDCMATSPEVGTHFYSKGTYPQGAWKLLRAADGRDVCDQCMATPCPLTMLERVLNIMGRDLGSSSARKVAIKTEGSIEWKSSVDITFLVEPAQCKPKNYIHKQGCDGTGFPFIKITVSNNITDMLLL